MIRSFIAIDLNPDVRRRLSATQDLLREVLPKEPIRWVRPDGIHLTLKFLGDQPPDRIESIQARLRDWAGEGTPLDLRIGGAGAFPDASRPRVVWVAVEEPSGRLQEWVDRLEAGLEGLGIRREERPFQPHLTLGRIKDRLSPSGLAALTKQLAALQGESMVDLHVETVCLFRSELRPSGAVYTILATAHLGRGRESE